MPMTSDAKSALSKTIRSLRTRLLDDLHAATEGVFRLSLDAKDAKLGEAARIKRERLESWIAEQVRALPEKEQEGAGERFRHEVEKEAASTLLNRIVFLRLLEASDLRAEKVVTGGWESRGYKDFREFAPELVRDDESEGYAQLLQVIFDDLAIDLPGLFGNVGLTALIPVPSATLRAVVEALDVSELDSCWTDDMTFGWIYQFWNDPEREHLDDKINPRASWGSGKIEPHEVASKTQLFTERYMVDWLLHNSLGPMWLAICKKNGWNPEVETDGTLARLEERRIEWRAKRESNDDSLTEFMHIESEAEKRWAYFVPQPISEVAVEHANDSVRDLKILDPAVGSGHFLVVAFDLLVALYREEARHRGEEGERQWSERAIVERILEYNLNGIDLDPRAVQIAAAALWLKAQLTCAGAQLRQLNLVASNLRISSLPVDDSARCELREEVERETGIPVDLTERIIDALTGADHLGSLLRIDMAVDEAIAQCEASLTRPDKAQGELFNDDWKNRRMSIDVEEAKSTLLNRLEQFLHAHGYGGDLGLKLRGEQLSAGVRFVRMVQEGGYDLVVANPPYQGTTKMADSKCLENLYPLGRADLYAMFLLRGLQLVRVGGISSMITMRGWMFTDQYAKLRSSLLENQELLLLCDLDWGAFREMKDVKVAMSLFRRSPPSGGQAICIAPTGTSASGRTFGDFKAKQSGLLLGIDRYEFTPDLLQVISGWPLVYWWSVSALDAYSQTEKIGEQGRVVQGISTTNDSRFFRRPWELQSFEATRVDEPLTCMALNPYVPLIKGAAGSKWIEPLDYLCKWAPAALGIRTIPGAAFRSPESHFRAGVAYAAIGNSFHARWHRYRSVCQNMGTSIFGLPLYEVTCAMNSNATALLAQSLNPGVHFEVGDAKRLPFQPSQSSLRVGSILESAFSDHESHREASVEYKLPGPSCWRHAQDWAQRQVDCCENDDLPVYTEEFDHKCPSTQISFALGVAIGRFHENGEGILNPACSDLSAKLENGICFLDGSLDGEAIGDSLSHCAMKPLVSNWTKGDLELTFKADIRTWLRLKFFGEVHKEIYEHRPIYFPVSSGKKTFVAYVSIHRWTINTLRALLAEHLHPAMARLEGEIADLRKSRDSSAIKLPQDSEERYEQVVQWRSELDELIHLVEQCSEKGPLPPDSKTPEREVDVRYVPNLDDGVMINSAALWPLLEPQWKDPKKWWIELASAKGKKDYDWSHLAARYFPTRVDKKCQQDPSLGVAHGCFWKYHPEIAYKWELRLQDEIASDFTIDEKGSDEARSAFEKEHPVKVEELVEAERKRRERNRKRRKKESASAGPLFDFFANEKDSARSAR